MPSTRLTRDSHRRTGTPITVLGRSNKNVLLAAHEYVAEYLRHEDRSPFLFVRGAGGGADMNKTLRLVERLEQLRNNGEVATFGEDTASYEQFVALCARTPSTMWIWSVRYRWSRRRPTPRP